MIALPEVYDAAGRQWTSTAAASFAGQHATCLLVEPQLEPSAAGVLFSRDPVTGEDVRVIEAARGLGEAIVAGLVTPDRFRVALSGSIVERQPGCKDLLVRRTLVVEPSKCVSMIGAREHSAWTMRSSSRCIGSRSAARQCTAASRISSGRSQVAIYFCCSAGRSR